jgi:hypothetical protein
MQMFRCEQAERSQMTMVRQDDSTVMLSESAAKHLDTQGERHFAAAQGDTRGIQHT